MKSSFTIYRSLLLPLLKSKTNDMDKSSIQKLKSVPHTRKSIKFIYKQRYENKDLDLEKDGYKVVRNVFKDKSKLNRLVLLSDVYDVNIQEFADKDKRFKEYVTDILIDDDFINEYYNVFQGPFLWQKSTIHRKKLEEPFFSKGNFTAEHIDLTETPNSKLTITAYIALTDQNEKVDSRLLMYPKSHLYNIIVPEENFDYVAKDSINTDVIGDVNEIISHNPDIAWMRECLYHLIVMNLRELDILKSTFLLLIYNPLIFYIKPVPINLRQGDVVFFLSDMVHGASQHNNASRSRVSLAVRGGYPYYEPSNLISKYADYSFYEGENKLKRDYFLFSGTNKMIEHIKDGESMNDIIYEITPYFGSKTISS